MSGTQLDSPHAKHDEYSAATGFLTTSEATSRSLQPVSPSVLSDLESAEGNIRSTSSLTVDTARSDSETVYTKKVYTEEQTHQLLERIDGLYSDMITRDLTRAEEAKLELLGNSIKTCHRIFGGLFDEGIGKENGEELEQKFVGICHDARMSVYTAEEKDKDGPSHKAQKEIGRQLKYAWNEHASSIIRTEDALNSEADKTDNKE